jgi:hypothetical protein
LLFAPSAFDLALLVLVFVVFVVFLFFLPPSAVASVSALAVVDDDVVVVGVEVVDAGDDGVASDCDSSKALESGFI